MNYTLAINVKTSADNEGLQKSSNALKEFSISAKDIITGGALLAIGQQVVEFGKQSINAASDVEEMQSKFNTVFKDLSGSVTNDLQEFADAANRSIFELQGYAATLQDTFVPLGFARDQAAGMSVELVKLAEDLASFNNLDTSMVVEDLQSALVGNTETLRKYGVVATQTAIDEKALALGFEFTKGKMDAQTKAATILQLTLDSTTDAQGDAIATAEGYANVSRGLEGATQELTAALGKQFLPTATSVKVELTEIVKAMAAAVNEGNRFRESVSDGGDTLLQNATAAAAYEKKLEELNSTGQGHLTVAQKQKIALLAAHNAMEAAIVSTKESELRQAALAQQYQVTTRALDQLTAITEEEREAMIAAGEAAQGEFDALEGLTSAQIQNTVQRNIAVQAAEAQAEADRMAAEAAAEHAEQQRQLAAATGDYFAAAINSEGAIGFFNESIDEMTDRQVFASNITTEQRESLGALREAYNKAADQVRDYELGIKGANLSDEARAEKISELSTQMASYEEQINSINAVGGEYVSVSGQMTINQDAVNQAIFAAADASGASAEQLALLGGALGIYSEEAVEAALKTAIIQAKIDELAGQFVAGQISIQEVRSQLENFPQTIETTFKTDTSQWNPPSTPTGGGFGGFGTSENTPQSLNTGGIIPGNFSQPVPIIAHGSEMVLNPSQQANLFALLNGKSGGSSESASITGVPGMIQVIASPGREEIAARKVSQQLARDYKLQSRAGR